MKYDKKYQQYNCIKTTREAVTLRNICDTGDNFRRMQYISDRSKDEYILQNLEYEKNKCKFTGYLKEIIVIPKGTELNLTSLRTANRFASGTSIEFSGTFVSEDGEEIIFHNRDSQTIDEYTYHDPVTLTTKKIESFDYLKMRDDDIKNTKRTLMREVSAQEYLDYYYEKCGTKSTQ